MIDNRLLTFDVQKNKDPYILDNTMATNILKNKLTSVMNDKALAAPPSSSVM